MPDRQPVVDAKQRMTYRVNDVFVDQVSLKVIDTRPQLLDHAELLFVDPKHQAMDLAAVVGEVGRYLAGEERAWEMGDLQGAGDSVVIGNRDKVHSTPLGLLVQVQRFDKTLRGADPPEKPFCRSVRMLAVNMEIRSSVVTILRHSHRSFLWTVRIEPRAIGESNEGALPGRILRSSQLRPHIETILAQNQGVMSLM